MKFKDKVTDVKSRLFGTKDDEVRKSEVIDITENIDELLPREMLEELSNGKGDD